MLGEHNSCNNTLFSIIILRFIGWLNSCMHKGNLIMLAKGTTFYNMQLQKHVRYPSRSLTQPCVHNSIYSLVYNCVTIVKLYLIYTVTGSTYININSKDDRIYVAIVNVTRRRYINVDNHIHDYVDQCTLTQKSILLP